MPFLHTRKNELLLLLLGEDEYKKLDQIKQQIGTYRIEYFDVNDNYE